MGRRSITRRYAPGSVGEFSAPLSGSTTVYGAWTGFDQNGVAESFDDRVARVTTLYGGYLAAERYFQFGTFQNWPQYYALNKASILSIDQNPATVAGGSLDTSILTWLRALPVGPTASRFYVCLNHEPDIGTPQDPTSQRNGDVHFHSLVQQVQGEGHTNVFHTPIFTNYGIKVNGPDFFLQWYPGDNFVDAIGWDCYWNSFGGRDTAIGCYDLAYQICQDRGKPFILPEVGVVNPYANGTTITDSMYLQIVNDTIAYLDTKAEAVCWFESNKADGDWRLAPHTAAKDAWKTVVMNSH